MFLIDNILLSPLHGVLWVAREIDKVAQEEQANESASIKADLSGLYLLLEKTQISEEEFDAREKLLLDRLDAIAERLAGEEVGDETEEEDEEKDEGYEAQVIDQLVESEPQGEGYRDEYKKTEKVFAGVGG